MPIEPPAVPTDNKPPSRVRRTFLVWLAMIALFVVIYIVMTPKPGSGHQDAVAQPSLWSAYLDLVLAAPLVLLPLLIFCVMFWNARRVGAVNRVMEPALLALDERRLAEADAVMTRVADRYRTAWAGALAHYNLSAIRVHRGDLVGAEAALVRVERWAGLAYGSDLRVVAAIGLAQVHALRGEVELARRWLDDATRRQERAFSRRTHRGLLVAVDMLVLVREQRYRDASALFDQRRVEVESNEPYDRLRLLWALDAFAQWHDSGPRNQGSIDALVRRLHPARPQEFAHVTGHWPELRAFLETHGVDAAAFGDRSAA